MTTHENPFRYGVPVEGRHYFPLPGFSRHVRSYLENRINIILYGPRRFGKTSFILDLIKEQEKSGSKCLLIDVYNITSHLDFFQQTIRALNKKQSWAKKILSKYRNFKLLPIADVDPITGQQSYSLKPDFTSSEDIKDIIQNTFTEIGRLDKKVLVVVDEFQKISQLEDANWLMHTVRTQMQELKNTVFLFSGSKKSVLYDMNNNQNNPFFKSCQLLDMPILGDDFTDWIIERFKSVKIDCDKKAIAELRRLVHDTPNYIQQVCFHIVAMQNIDHIGNAEIERALHTIVKQNAYAFETLLSSLTLLQQRVLRLCANEPEAIFSKKYIKKYEITSGPALATTINSLKQKGILDPGSVVIRGQVVFDDPLFKIWLKKEL